MTKPSPNQLDAAGEAALERALRRAWHPVCRADELTEKPKAVRLCGEALVVVRLGGQVAA